MASENTSNDLASRIAGTEGRHSLFEDSSRKLPVQVCKVFLDSDGNIAPATFQACDLTLPSKDRERTEKAFPITVAKHKNLILEGKHCEGRCDVAGETGGGALFRRSRGGGPQRPCGTQGGVGNTQTLSLASGAVPGASFGATCSKSPAAPPRITSIWEGSTSSEPTAPRSRRPSSSQA